MRDHLIEQADAIAALLTKYLSTCLLQRWRGCSSLRPKLRTNSCRQMSWNRWSLASSTISLPNETLPTSWQLGERCKHVQHLQPSGNGQLTSLRTLFCWIGWTLSEKSAPDVRWWWTLSCCTIWSTIDRRNRRVSWWPPVPFCNCTVSSIPSSCRAKNEYVVFFCSLLLR